MYKVKLLYHIDMSALFIGILLVVIALLPVTIRVFSPKLFERQQKLDSLSIVPVILLLVCFLLFCAFGCTYSILIVTTITFIVFLTNLRNFYNLCMGLTRGSFSFPIKIISILQTIILVIILITVFVYSPVLIKNEQPKVTSYYGSSKSGYQIREDFFEKTTAQQFLFKAYKAEEETSEDIIEENPETSIEKSIETQKNEIQVKNVLYIPDIYVMLQDSQGTLSFLAEKGYDVHGFAFYDTRINYFNNYKDNSVFRNFCLRNEYAKNKEKLIKNNELFINAKKKEYISALKILKNENITSVYILAEGNCVQAAREIQNQYPELVVAVYEIKADEKLMDNYIDGFANLQQTRPFEAAMIKLPKNRNWDNAKKISFSADKYFSYFQLDNESALMNSNEME